MHVYTRDQLIALRRFAAPFHDAARRAVLSAGGVPRHRRLRDAVPADVNVNKPLSTVVNQLIPALPRRHPTAASLGKPDTFVDELRHTETLATAPSSSR